MRKMATVIGRMLELAEDMDDAGFIIQADEIDLIARTLFAQDLNLAQGIDNMSIGDFIEMIGDGGLSEEMASSVDIGDGDDAAVQDNTEQLAGSVDEVQTDINRELQDLRNRLLNQATEGSGPIPANGEIPT